jgi:hypothetical protein
LRSGYATTEPTTGNRKKKWAEVYYNDRAYTPLQEQEWNRHGTNIHCSAVTSTTRPEIYKNGLAKQLLLRLQFPAVLLQIKTSFGENIKFLNIACEKET